MLQRRSPLLLLIIGVALLTSGCFFGLSDTSNAVRLSPGTDLQSAANSHSEGTTFLLESGTFYGQSVEPRSGQSFVGSEGTVLNGNGAESAFNSHLRATNVLIENIEFTNYNPGSYRAVIDAASQYWGDGSWRTPTNWIINGVHIHNNGGAGDSSAIEVGSGTVVNSSRIENNNGLGIFGNANGVRVQFNVISNNAKAASDVLHHSGGMKLVMTHNANISNNTISNNNGPGVWFDISADNSVVANNTITGNSLAGIHYEISRGASITDNVLDNNAWGDPRGWLHAASITVSTSWNVTVSGNKVSNAPGGITVFDQRTLRNQSGGESSMPGFGRIYDGEWRGDNVTVSGNTLINTGINGASAGQHESYGSNIYNSARFYNNSFQGNTTYYWGSGNNYASSVGASGFAGYGQS